jgi:hypothetical protein
MNMRKRSVIAASIVLSSLVACGNGYGSDSPGPDDSGIRGIVLAGPQCPVVVAESPCPDRPWEGTVRISGESGEVIEVATDAGGRFTVVVEPGAYDVEPVVEEPGPVFGQPEAVTVVEGAFIDVALSVDTGIR